MPKDVRSAKSASKAKGAALIKRQSTTSKLGSALPNTSLARQQQHDSSHAVLKALGAKCKQPEDEQQDDRDTEPATSRVQADQKILEIVKHSLLPFSDKLDPFAQLPVTLDRFQEHLVSFYLLYYPKVTYGLSTRLRPHPVATNFSIAINNPPNFQIALARSALYRLTLQKYANEKEKQELEVALIHHKGEAIRMVREMAKHDDHPNYTDNMVASIISLGTLDRRTGSEDTASMHFTAVRRILRSVGGPLGIKSVLLSRVMVHFESIYGTATGSYIWDSSDVACLLNEANQFFGDIWDMWVTLCRRNSMTSTSSSTESVSVTAASMITATSTTSTPAFESFALPAASTLRKAFSTPLKDSSEACTPRERSNLIFQLACLFTLCDIVLDHKSDRQALTTYMSSLNEIVENTRLEGQPCNNHLWLIQIHDQTSSHSRRTWRAASFTWLLKHVHYSTQKEMRNWLLGFMIGEPVIGKSMMKLDAFHFSYSQ